MKKGTGKSQVTAWYVSVDGKATGPVSTEMVRSMIRGGQIQKLDLVYREADVEWKPVASFQELMGSKRTWHRDSDLIHPASSGTDAIDDFTPSVSPLVTWVVLRPHAGTYLQEGPFSTAAIADGLKKGRFQYGQYAWRAGLASWKRIGDLPEFDRRSEVRAGSILVPPPLPDPIEAVLLEDETDAELEEFQVLASAGDRTPAPDAEHELKPQEPDSPPTVGIDLAALPWEAGGEPVLPSAEEPEWLEDMEVGDQDFPELPATPSGLHSVVPPSRPVSLSPSRPDRWERWGRMVAATGFAVLATIFLSHVYATSRGATPMDRGSGKVDGGAKAELPPSTEAPAQSSAEEAESVNLPAPVVAAPPAISLSIVSLKLDSPTASDAGFVFEGAIPVGAKIEVSVRGRLGQVFGVMNVRENRTIVRREGEVPTLPLSQLRLPEGSYSIEARVLDVNAIAEVFIGVRDGRFMSRLEYYLKEISHQTQTQKREIFYSAKELNFLTRLLAENYGQLRGNQGRWDRFYRKWKGDLGKIEKSIAELRANRPENLAYPEETAQLGVLYSSVVDAGAQYDSGIKQRRDVASDALTDIIAELERSQHAFGDLSSRSSSDEQSSSQQ